MSVVSIISFISVRTNKLTMERELFQPMYANVTATGEYSPYDPYLSGSFSTFPSLSLMSLDQERANLLSSSSSSLHDYPSSTPETEFVASGDFRGKQVAAEYSRLKVPKYEPSPEVLTFPYGCSSVPVSNAFYSGSFGQLPDLRSFEHVNDYDLAVGDHSLSRKRTKPASSSSLELELQSPTTDAYFLESLFRSFEFSNNVSAAPANPPPANPPPAPARKSQVDVARRRRYSLSEKTRSLQKLLPWDTKMDLATMFEEAHKYIRFLQAQVSVLQFMPEVAGTGTTNFSTVNPNVMDLYGGLGRLNRQQLLEVVVNSPVAQTVLYSKGFCVYSVEQLHSLKKIAEKKLLSYNPSVHH